MLTGYNSERAIVIRKCKWMSWEFREKCLQKALEFLQLPKKYLWVIDNSHYYAIIVKTKEDFPLPNTSADGITFIWKGSLVVPSGKRKLYPHNYFWRRLPERQENMETLDAEKVISCVLKLRKATAKYKEQKPKKSPFIFRMFCPRKWTMFEAQIIFSICIVATIFTCYYLLITFLAPHPKYSPFVGCLILSLLAGLFIVPPIFAASDTNDYDKYF